MFGICKWSDQYFRKPTVRGLVNTVAASLCDVFKAVVALNVVPISAFVSSSLVDCFGFLLHQQGWKSKSVIGKLGYDGPNRRWSRNKKNMINFDHKENMKIHYLRTPLKLSWNVMKVLISVVLFSCKQCMYFASRLLLTHNKVL